AALIASQIPFLVEERDGRLVLQCHLARANPQLQDLDGAAEALAVFAGPHAYISPSWYEAGPSVPTWNYASVHAYGPSRRIEDAEWLHDLVRRLSDRHEAHEAAQGHAALPMQDSPGPYAPAMVKVVVWIAVTLAS